MTEDVILLAGIMLRIASIVGFIFLILPRQFKEARHKDELVAVRRLLLLFGVLFLFTTSFSLIVNFCRVGVDCRYLDHFSVVTGFTNSIGDFVTFVIFYLIYRSKYVKIKG